MMIRRQSITLIVKLSLQSSMLRSSLCDYSDSYILASDITAITGAGDNDAASQLDERNKGVILKIVHHLLTA